MLATIVTQDYGGFAPTAVAAVLYLRARAATAPEDSADGATYVNYPVT